MGKRKGQILGTLEKGFTAESNTWKGRENLKNAKEAIKEFEKEYQ